MSSSRSKVPSGPIAVMVREKVIAACEDTTRESNKVAENIESMFVSLNLLFWILCVWFGVKEVIGANKIIEGS